MLAAERDGVFLALSRSQELTQGSRWRILSLALAVLAAELAISLLLTFLCSHLLDVNLRSPQFTAGYVLGGGLLTLIVNLMWSTVLASLYVELIERKEGGRVENLVDVFA